MQPPVHPTTLVISVLFYVVLAVLALLAITAISGFLYGLGYAFGQSIF